MHKYASHFLFRAGHRVISLYIKDLTHPIFNDKHEISQRNTKIKIKKGRRKLKFLSVCHMFYEDGSKVPLPELWKHPSWDERSLRAIQSKGHNSSFIGAQENVLYGFRCSDPHNTRIIIFENPSFTLTSPKEKLLPEGTDLGGLVS